VLQKAELSAQADSENNLGGSSEISVLHRTRLAATDPNFIGTTKAGGIARSACAAIASNASIWYGHANNSTIR
jgi:hypothetical protein